MASRHPPPASTHRADPASEPPRISLTAWLVVGGTGPPPTMANFCLMASERKAANRRAKTYEEARKAASAAFEEKWPGTTKRQKPPDRRELMRLYGPKGAARRRTGEGETGHGRGDADCNDDNDDDGDGNDNNGNGDNNGAGGQ
ncbi:hypothetical protein F5B21DRAFT_445230 [Xylaria acuta]|nr:hypothetical protein F5B21DRAFT_445230 [Xylaria acuta]